MRLKILNIDQNGKWIQVNYWIVWTIDMWYDEKTIVKNIIMWNLKHDTFNFFSQYTQIYILNCITILTLPLLANCQGLLKVSAQYAISDGTEPVDHRTLAPHRAPQSRYRHSAENNKQLKVSSLHGII